MSNSIFLAYPTTSETLSKTKVSRLQKHIQCSIEHDSSTTICRNGEKDLEVFALATRGGKVIASFTNKDAAAKALSLFAYGVRIRIKKTRHTLGRPGQSAAMTRRQKIQKMLLEDFTL